MAIDREKVLLAAQGFIHRKRYDRAVAEYQKIIQQDPDDARTLLKIGDLQSKMEAHAAAVATYDRVGKYYATQGFALKAIAVYKQIREIIHKHVPEVAERYGHIAPQLAELYAQLGLVSDALAAYDEVATQLQRSGQDARAVEFFQKIVHLDETNPLSHLRLAEAYSRIKNTDDAIRHFGSAARILTKQKRDDDALKVLERLLHHRPDPSYARLAAEIYLARDRPNDGMLALAKLQICFQADPKSIETLGLLARTFVVIGQAAKSIEVQKELARTAKEQGNFNVWRDTVNRLLQVAPNDEQVQRLASSPPGRSVSSVPAAALSEPPPSITEAEIEELSADDIELEKSESSHPPASNLRPALVVRPPPRPSAVSTPELEVSEAAPLDADAEASADLDLHPRRIFSDAESFHKLGLFEKAIARLDEGIEAHPRSMPLRRKLRDILYEAGDLPRTADQMVQLAHLLLEDGDTNAAAEELSTILSFVPDHADARQMLLDLGYELPTAEYSTVMGSDSGRLEDVEEAMSSDQRARASRPTYDVEEEDLVRSAESTNGDLRGETYEETDEAEVEEESLPSFPMDDQNGAHAEAESAAFESSMAPRGARSGGTEVIEDALEEAEFFLSRGLLEDARTIIEEQLRRLPNHPLLRERMQELDQAISESASSSGTRERPLHQQPEATEDRSFDIAASLDALDALDALGPSSSNPLQTGDQIDVEEVFAKFKAGVRAQVSETDSATHYDLGLAYREMDLLQDAIDEFELASRDTKRECVCQSMIGMIRRSQGNLGAAVDAFIKGLHAEHKTPEQELSLYYELGDAYESKGNPTEALYYFRKVAHRAPNHEDVRGSVDARIRTVQGLGHRPSMERAVGASDEFAAAFDALSGGKS